MPAKGLTDGSASHMKVIVNGKPHVHRGEGDVASVVKELGAGADRVAVMVNDAIIARDKWGQSPVKEGDRIEVLTFMGGG